MSSGVMRRCRNAAPMTRARPSPTRSNPLLPLGIGASRAYRWCMTRYALVITLVVVVAGLVLVLTLQSLLGMLLIIGGVMALALMMLPESIDRVAGFLATGSFRRR
jgi:hypothetical protein